MSTVFSLIPPTADKYGDTYNPKDVIAHRHYGGKDKGAVIAWTVNRKREIEIALLDDETPVYALDNTAQGIETLGDIRKKIKEQLKKEQLKNK